MINSHNVIILAYNQYSCGKFIGNILSYNKNFVPQFSFNVDRGAWYSKEYYNSLSIDELQSIKHETVMLTVPDSNNATNWLDYELGCPGFWGTNSISYTQDTITPRVIELLDRGIKCFIVAHDPKNVEDKKEYFPNATVIQLINDSRINWLSRQLKMKVPKPLMDEFKNYKCFDYLEFDIDTLFDQEKFFDNIAELLKKLNIDDCSLDPRVNEYYQKYCNLYSNLL